MSLALHPFRQGGRTAIRHAALAAAFALTLAAQAAGVAHHRGRRLGVVGNRVGAFGHGGDVACRHLHAHAIESRAAMPSLRALQYECDSSACRQAIHAPGTVCCRRPGTGSRAPPPPPRPRRRAPRPRPRRAAPGRTAAAPAGGSRSHLEGGSGQAGRLQQSSNFRPAPAPPHPKPLIAAALTQIAGRQVEAHQSRKAQPRQRHLCIKRAEQVQRWCDEIRRQAAARTGACTCTRTAHVLNAYCTRTTHVLQHTCRQRSLLGQLLAQQLGGLLLLLQAPQQLLVPEWQVGRQASV